MTSSRKLALLPLLVLTACAQVQPQVQPQVSAAPAEAPRAEAKRMPPLPAQELSAQILYQYLVGEIALQRGQPELATEALLDLARASRDPRLAERATETAVQGRQMAQAVDAAVLWQSLDPEAPQAALAAAALLLASGRLNEARPYLEAIVAGEGESRPGGFLHLNQMLVRQSDKEAVLTLVRELARPYPANPEAHVAVAQAAVAAGRREEALAELRQAADLRRGWEFVAVLQGQVLRETSATAALDHYRAFLRDNPGARDVRLAYARLLVSEKQFHLARAEFQGMVDETPGNPDISAAIGLLALQEGDLEAADSYLRLALANGHKDADTLRYYLGQAAEEDRRWEDAMAWYGGIGPGEHHLNAQMRYAGLLAKQGKLPEARRHLRQISALGNQQRVLLIQAEAQLLREARQYQDAFDVLGFGLEAMPDNPDLLYDHAMAAEKLDLLDVMERDLRHLIRIKSDNAQAYNALGYTLAERGVRLDEARELVEKAISLAPDDPYIMDSLGWVYFRLGQNVRATEILRRALELNRDPEIAAHLGEVLWEQGLHDEARKVWRSALKLAPDSEVLRNVMQKFK